MKPVNLILMCIFIFVFVSSFPPLTFAQAQEENEEEVLALPDKIILSVSNITVGESTTGLIGVNGIIINNTTESVQDVNVDVTLYDAKNDTIRETSRFVTAPFSSFGPGSTEGFSFLIIAENFDHYTATSYGKRIQ